MIGHHELRIAELEKRVAELAANMVEIAGTVDSLLNSANTHADAILQLQKLPGEVVRLRANVGHLNDEVAGLKEADQLGQR